MTTVSVTDFSILCTTTAVRVDADGDKKTGSGKNSKCCYAMIIIHVGVRKPDIYSPEKRDRLPQAIPDCGAASLPYPEEFER